MHIHNIDSHCLNYSVYSQYSTLLASYNPHSNVAHPTHIYYIVKFCIPSVCVAWITPTSTPWTVFLQCLGILKFSKAQYLFKEIVCFTSLWVENAYKLAAGAVVHNIICSNYLFYVVAVFCCVVYLVNAPRTSRLSVQCLRCTYITSIHIAWITLYIHNIQHCWRPIILIQTLHTPHTYTILLSFVYQVSVLRG